MFFSMFLRSFFIQAGWNYERFQNMGFAFALLPALKKIYPDPARFKTALLRHLALINTQPYMAGFVIGNTAKMEEELAAGPASPETERKMLGVKQALASSFASIGDRIFWGRLVPLTTQLCIIVWMVAGFYGWLFPSAEYSPSVAVLMVGPLLGILAYSALTVHIRWQGIKRGYACGGGANCGLDAMNWQKIIKWLSIVGFSFSVAIAVSAFAVLIFVNCASCSMTELAIKIALVAGALGVQRVARMFGRSIFFSIWVILGVSVLLFAVFKIGRFNIHL